MELKAHDGGDAPGFSNQGFLHDISDDGFGIWACWQVNIWPELGCCGNGYVQEKEQEEIRHIFCTCRWVCKMVQLGEIDGHLYGVLE